MKQLPLVHTASLEVCKYNFYMVA